MDSWQDEQEEIEREHRAERFCKGSDELETLCNALGEVWDQMGYEVEEGEDDFIHDILDALRAALEPWKDEIIRRYKAARKRKKYGMPAERLLGEDLPALPRRPE